MVESCWCACRKHRNFGTSKIKLFLYVFPGVIFLLKFPGVINDISVILPTQILMSILDRRVIVVLTDSCKKSIHIHGLQCYPLGSKFASTIASTNRPGQSQKHVNSLMVAELGLKICSSCYHVWIGFNISCSQVG